MKVFIVFLAMCCAFPMTVVAQLSMLYLPKYSVREFIPQNDIDDSISIWNISNSDSIIIDSLAFMVDTIAFRQYQVSWEAHQLNSTGTVYRYGNFYDCNYQPAWSYARYGPAMRIAPKSRIVLRTFKIDCHNEMCLMHYEYRIGPATRDMMVVIRLFWRFPGAPYRFPLYDSLAILGMAEYCNWVKAVSPVVRSPEDNHSADRLDCPPVTVDGKILPSNATSASGSIQRNSKTGTVLIRHE
jgi:hypothetical protein